jgi:hypothetical protein
MSMNWKQWAALVALVAAPHLSACKREVAEAPTPSALLSAAPKDMVVPPVEERVYEAGLQPGWQDTGWSERILDPAPARIRMSEFGGWSIHKPGLQGAYGGLSFRMRVPPHTPDFLEVRLDSSDSRLFPRVRVEPRHLVGREGDWLHLYLPIEELNPEVQPFDRIVLRAYARVSSDFISIDNLALTAVDPSRMEALQVGGGRSATRSVKPARLSIDCQGAGHPISPLIYGIAFSNLREHEPQYFWELGPTARRWGGNPTSRYNWKLGNAWNTGEDYYFRNVVLGKEASYTYDSFLEANRAKGVKSALTVPMIGWVAKDTSSVSFPLERFGEQQEMDPELPEAGNGVNKLGRKVKPGPPTLTSVPAPPEFIAEWVREIRRRDERRGRSVQMYILDNEPMLWNSTHRDVHPEPTTYDELLKRTVDYATAIRQVDEEALIAGPALWGWTAYFFSAADVETGGRYKDHKAHGKVPLLPWYLRKLREHERSTGLRLLDVVDVHFYPQSDVGYAEEGATDDETSARRIRSTRALWDPTYKDESWIDDTVMLIPRLKEWIEDNYPGRLISLGEYNFGATTHMSGGLAQAEALGRFAEQDVYSAFYWTFPPDKSPAYWAFRAYRNFDGRGGRFLDYLIPSRSEPGVSLFASRDKEGQHVVAVVLNLEADVERSAQVVLQRCGGVAQARVLQYAGDPRGFAQREPKEQKGSALEVSLPPWSMTVVDVKLESPVAGQATP